ncbi:hypothetical protein FNF29_06174 [Cafeteria roenbergensis]|uniref:Uncharacterized protein n=1 Tax=Cafeteria roenbergensis TaxID=33653 RepID=A0A5A8C7L9_CAFRO|nr:hypothetical protein FNF29_06174 [Cafeteria roenbergensis]KAA0163050.1 hypothetical protein FNF28_04440 [Cafeteria roenbergensis]|eukprot:KAA0149086.1 hypothetical protein FNF29_06174 [Cafeteria roenbergensis]
MAHDPDMSSTALYAALQERARKPAKGVIQGPLQEWRPSRRPLHHQSERERADYLVHQSGRAEDGVFTVEKGGDGSHTKFTKGFFRRTGAAKEQAAARAAAQEAKERRRVAHEAHRRAALEAAESKSGFNVVRGTFDPARGEPARGRAFRDHKPSSALAKEGERMMRDSHMRFHRVPGAPRAADAARTARLEAGGLPDAPRRSAVLGYGRADIESFGVRDALDKSEYERPELVRARAAAAAAAAREASEAEAATLARSMAARQAAEGPGAEMVGKSRRLKAGEREPDRVFGHTEAKLAAAMPDDEKKMIRLDREIARAVGPRPADRPANLLVNAARLGYERERRRLAEEIALVRDLP